MKKKFRVLALCGSLKKDSSNLKILKEAVRLAPTELAIEIGDFISTLPHFNPDEDLEPAPLAVEKFRKALQAADAVMISSPEYAHGVPGAFKNAMDWTVSSGDFDNKPVILIQASTTGGEFARPQMIENLKTMGARVLQTESMQTPVVRKAFNENGQLVDEKLLLALMTSLQTLIQELSQQQH